VTARTRRQGLDGASGVAVSADGKSAYVGASLDNAIVRFNREDPPETQIDFGPPATTTDSTPPSASPPTRGA